MEPFTLATAHFIMNGIKSKPVHNSFGTNEQELHPLQPRKAQHLTNGHHLRLHEEEEEVAHFDDDDDFSAAESERTQPKLIEKNSDKNSIAQEEPEEKVLQGFIWNEANKSATYVGQNAWHIPASLTSCYANRIRKLDLSYNCLQTLAGIEFFNSLEELVLDNNLLDDSIRFFYNPLMQTLSINKNKITDLERFLNEISLKLPNLTYLSLLGNPACPDQLSSSDHDEQDYRRYRSYVVHRIPMLRFLDSSAIRAQEREEAQQRGHYYRLIRLNSDSFIEKQRTVGIEEDFHQQTDAKRHLTPLPFEEANRMKGGYGRLRHRYTGKHSEGNRFIRNHEL